MKATTTLVFNQNHEGVKHLCSLDERLALLINIIGDYSLTLRDDYYLSLTRSIIGQQLSATVARVIWERFYALCETDVSPSKIQYLSDEQIRSIGISKPKIQYIRSLSQSVLTGELDFSFLKTASEHDVLTHLTKIKGIGVWTAQMFMIFSLGRLDIFSLGDAGLQRASQWLYSLPDKVPNTLLEEFAKKWTPYRTIASLYLWEAIDSGLISKHYSDLMPGKE